MVSQSDHLFIVRAIEMIEMIELWNRSNLSTALPRLTNCKSSNMPRLYNFSLVSQGLNAQIQTMIAQWNGLSWNCFDAFKKRLHYHTFNTLSHANRVYEKCCFLGLIKICLTHLFFKIFLKIEVKQTRKFFHVLR
jgi:hypothetical protein